MTRHVTAHAARCNVAGRRHATIDHAHTRARFPMTYLFSRRRNDVLERGKRDYLQCLVSFPPSAVTVQRNDAALEKQRKLEWGMIGETYHKGTVDTRRDANKLRRIP